MAIQYPVSPDSRWAVYQVSTGQIVVRNATWPRADYGPVEGMDPDYIHLLHVNDTAPDYDSRLYILQGTETIDVEANALHLTWTTPRRPINESIMAAENIETEKLEALVGQLAREAVATRLVVGAIVKYALKAQVYPAKVQTLVDNYEAKAVKVWNNRDRLNQIIADLNAGSVPNLDGGWTVV